MKAKQPLAALSVFREIRRGAGDQRPLAVAGARELVPLLARELRAGGDPSAVVEGRVEGAAILIWVGPPDEDALRAAKGAGVPIIALTDERSVPYVLAEDIVRVPPGQGFPVDAIARAVARRLGENGTALAAKLPVLRPAVCNELIRSFSKKNGIIAAAIFVPGVDMPILTLNQIRLVLRLALAHGQEVDRDRAIELAGVVGAGFGFRAIARQLLDFVPVRRLGGQGRDRLRRHAGDRRGGAEVLRHQVVTVRSRSYALCTPNGGDTHGPDRTPRSHGAAPDRGGRRVVRVPRGDARAVDPPVRRGRALGLGASLAAAACDPRPPRQAPAGRRSRLTRR